MSPHPRRFLLLAAGLFGGTGVALGAMGAHRLGPLLAQRGMIDTWETAARYHLFHALALLALAAIPSGAPGARRLVLAAWSWSIGVVLFSGSLYWFAVGGPRPLVYATPIGGVFLLAGWACVMAAAFARAAGGEAGATRP